uniref:Uncharacterized protein n=1 Tax=Opuntia streptacantha TaxID=393608 RepID=A0A7C9CYN7_OPUST
MVEQLHHHSAHMAGTSVSLKLIATGMHRLKCQCNLCIYISPPVVHWCWTRKLEYSYIPSKSIPSLTQSLKNASVIWTLASAKEQSNTSPHSSTHYNQSYSLLPTSQSCTPTC